MIVPSRPPAPRPLPRWTARLVIALAAVVVSVAAAAGCGMATADSEYSPSIGGAGDADGSADDDAGLSNPALNSASDAGAGSNDAVKGSALCNVRVAASPCFPDDVPVAAAGCTASPQAPAPADAGADGGASLGDGGPDPTIACHVVRDPEDAGVAPMCLPAGPKSAGAACLKATDCASGYECVGNPGQCLHYCCSGECDDKQTFCDVEVAVGGATVPVCTAVRSCKLLVANVCDPGTTCAIVNDNGTTSCVEIGSAKVNEECNDRHCAEGLTCLGHTEDRKCYELCRKGTTTCPSGQSCKGYAPTFRDPDVGVCQN